MTALRPTCMDQGYSDCAPDDYANAEGTSFSTPQVSAAAAMLLAVDPNLKNSQVAAILEHTADDVNASTGCGKCAVGRDPYTGWGRLDVARAVAAVTAGPLPATDMYETNDDAGAQAWTIWGKQRSVDATLDYYDDPVDVYRVSLTGHEKLTARLTGGWQGAKVKLVLWRPDTASVANQQASTQRAAQSVASSGTQRLTFTAPGRGWYYVEAVVTAPGSGSYSLTLTKTG
jgi:subtilisin family serine protease